MSSGFRSLFLLLLTLAVYSSALAWQGLPAKEDSLPERLPVLQADALRFWKGNLHTHSLWSDGDDFPEMIADWYKRHGYHFLTLSDHNVLSEGQRWISLKPAGKAFPKYLARFGPAWVEQRTFQGKDQVRLKPLAEFRSLLEEPGRFLLIPGEEITHRFARKPVHLNGINLRDVIVPINGDSVTETISANLRAVQEQARKTGWRNLAFLNHPNFGWGVRAEDLFASDELRFMEVYNGHPSVKNYGDDLHAGCERMWDIVLALRLGKWKLPALLGLATDDAHGYHAWGVGKVNPGRGWLMVRASCLSAENIVKAMLAGDFYASTGVTLREVCRNGKTLKLNIAAQKGVSYRTQFIATMKEAALDAQPLADSKGNPLEVTGHYSAAVGQVVAQADSLEPAYTFTGRELYVRARILSSQAHPNPFQKGDREMAWTQPMAP